MHSIMVPALGPLLVAAHEHKVSLLKSKSQSIRTPEASAKSVSIMAHGRGLSSCGWPVIALLWTHFLLLPLLTLWQPPDPLPVSDTKVYHQDAATSCRFSLHRSAFLSLALLYYNPSCPILRVLMLSIWLKGKLRHLGLLSGRNCIDSF